MAEETEMRSYTTISVRPEEKQRLKEHKKPGETYGEALKRRDKMLESKIKEVEELREKVQELEEQVEE